MYIYTPLYDSIKLNYSVILVSIYLGETAEMIYEAYCKEAKIKREILNQVAHHYTESMDIFHLTAWTHQTSISHNLERSLEILFIATNLRGSN